MSKKGPPLQKMEHKGLIRTKMADANVRKRNSAIEIHISVSLASLGLEFRPNSTFFFLTQSLLLCERVCVPLSSVIYTQTRSRECIHTYTHTHYTYSLSERKQREIIVDFWASITTFLFGRKYFIGNFCYEKQKSY